MATVTSPTRTLYPYCNADGTEYCQVVRVDKPEDGKDIFTLPSGLTGPHPVYRADRLAALPAETPIYIVEGEKCVEALEGIGLTATTSKGGSNSAHKTDWTPLQRFTRVIILPDNDEAGRKYAQDVLEALKALPGSRKVVVCDLPGLGDKEDVVDFLGRAEVALGRDGQPDRDALRENLLAVIKEHGRPAHVGTVSVDEWPEPKPVVAVLPVVTEVRMEMLPERIRDWVFDATKRMQAPVDFMAVSAITMLGTSIGRKLTIRPKAQDNWSVKPNVWACLVGPPAAMKSPALKEARRFLDAIDRDEFARYQEAMEQYERQLVMYEIQMKIAKAKIKQELNDAACEDAVHNLPDKPEPPVRMRNYTQDTTVEKLQVLLQQNPRGILVMRDEISGFLRGLDKPGQEGSRAFYLEGWEGNGRYCVDRIGRGSSVIDGVCLSVLGCATPGGMSDYVAEALGDGEGADGLLQRFSLVAFPDTQGDFQYVDRKPDNQAAMKAEQAFRACNNIDVYAIGAECYPDSLPFLRYTPEAQRLFQDWYSELIVRCRRDDDHPAIQSHLLKFSKMVPALGLIFHVTDGGHGSIPERCFLMAAAWADYAESHARRLYQSAFSNQAVHGATVLLRHIEAGDLQDGFTLRDIVRKAWTGLAKQKSAQAAVDELVETGHLRGECDKKPSGGRSTLRYLIHPKYGRADHE